MITPRPAPAEGELERMLAGKPVRLQLSRKKGFNLQALSRATNGLECVNVTRQGAHSGMWGNGAAKRLGLTKGQPAVDAFIAWINDEASWAWKGRAAIDLRGKNLACACRLGEPCHADVLLELANKPPVLHPKEAGKG